jgi:hypothetical protein
MSWPRSVGAGRVLCVAQTMVYVLNVLSEVAPEWVRVHVPAEWVACYGERLEHERMPKEEEERKQYANQVGVDGWGATRSCICSCKNSRKEDLTWGSALSVLPG